MFTPSKVVICGAGLHGSALAYYLTKSGHTDVRLPTAHCTAHCTALHMRWPLCSIRSALTERANRYLAGHDRGARRCRLCGKWQRWRVPGTRLGQRAHRTAPSRLI
jgi:glycine/D-amino acid oxidase-like deaminating enzyme